MKAALAAALTFFATGLLMAQQAVPVPPDPTTQGEIDGKFTVSKLWKGQDLWPFAREGQGKYEGAKDPNDWHSMSGAIVSFAYSGTGPLPAPVEFVIPLDKPMPYGPSYRLFVKNFYRGTMEVSIGDVTAPAEIRRFDWTPGVVFEPNAQFNKIVLRYFPSAMVPDTGAKQSQIYIIQGVFLTTDTNKVPIRAGEILETVPQKAPPAKAGNYLENASFEVGMFPWGKPFGISAAYGPENLDDSTATHGRTSFKRTIRGATSAEERILDTRNYRLPEGSYTLSFYAKADQPVRLHARLSGATEDLKSDASTPFNQAVELTTEWKRYTITANLQALAGFLYHLSFGAEAKSTATIWLDAVQLQNGPLKDFQPAQAAEIGYRCSTPGHIFYSGQGSEIELQVHDTTGQPKIPVDYRVIDYWGKEVGQGRAEIPLQANNGRLPLNLPAAQTGIFRLLLKAGTASSEMIYSVVPANPHLESKYPEGTLGVDATFEDKQLSILKRANFNWVISKHLARWSRIERAPGNYDFGNGEAIAAAARANMMILLQPLNLEWDCKVNQPWLYPSFRPRKTTGQPWNHKDEYVRHWGNYVYALVNQYKDHVKHWEIENEPNAAYTPDEYALLFQTAVDSARRADPEAHIVAGAGGGFYPEYYEAALQAVGPDKVDALSVHLYTGNTADKATPFGTFLTKHQKPGWNTETGATCPTFFTTLPEYEPLRTKDYWENLQRDVRQVTLATVHNYLLSLSLSRMEKYFHYFGRFANCAPSQPTSRFGGGKEIVEFDGSLRANGVALCVASHFLDGSKYHGPVSLDDRLQFHLFQKGEGSTGFLFGPAAQPLNLTLDGGSEVRFFDLMGNPVETTPFRVTDSPLYFTTSTPPAAAVGLFSKARLAVPAP